MALVALSLCTACSGGENEDKAAAKEEVIKVSVATVSARPVNQVEEFTATVEADVKNSIAPSMAVRIEKILVDVGDRVSKGQQLVQMDQAGLIQAKLQLQNRETEFQRVDELYKIGGVSKSDWDALKMALDVAKTSFQNLAENTVLTSPISGVVTARNYDNGDMYSQGNPVLVIEKISPVKLVLNVSESYFKAIKLGMPAKLKLEVYGDEEFLGKVSLIYPTVNPDSRTFSIEISLPNDNQRVRPGMFARAELNLGVENRVVVPDRAVIKQTGSGERFVYVYNKGKVSYNKVELGRRMGNEYELISGVPTGSQVVIAGQTKLHDGSAVTLK